MKVFFKYLLVPTISFLIIYIDWLGGFTFEILDKISNYLYAFYCFKIRNVDTDLLRISLSASGAILIWLKFVLYTIILILCHKFIRDKIVKRGSLITFLCFFIVVVYFTYIILTLTCK